MRRSITISEPNGTKKTDSPQRGRPREFEAPEALRKAMLTFWEKGYHATSLDDLTTSTGVQKSSLYAAFGDKESIFQACLERYFELVGSGELSSLKNGSSPKECLTSFFAEVIRATTPSNGPRGCMIVCVLSELASKEGPLRMRLLEIIRGNDRAIASRLREIGFPGDCEEAGMLASTLIMGYAVRARSGESRSKLIKSIPAAVEMVLSVGS